MPSRLLILFFSLAVVAAACGGQATSSTTTTTTPDTTTIAAPEGIRLSYALEPGVSLGYEVDIDQSIDLTSSGDGGSMGGGEELPGSATLDVTGTTKFDYSVTDGAEPGTYEVTITSDFSGLEFSGVVDGEEVSGEDVPAFAGMDPVNLTLTVDEQGNVIPDDSGFEDEMFGDFGALGMLDQLGSAGVAQFVGPPFAEEEVSVGDTWSETIEVPTMPDAEPITTVIESEVSSTDTIDGHEVFVIETVTTTSPIEFDLAELLLGFMFAFVPDDATAEERAEMDAMAEQLRVMFNIDETVANQTTWFDHQAGVTRRSTVDHSTHMVMDVNMPDEATGEMMAFGVDMQMDQSLTYRLVGEGDA